MSLTIHGDTHAGTRCEVIVVYNYYKLLWRVLPTKASVGANTVILEKSAIFSIMGFKVKMLFKECV